MSDLEDEKKEIIKEEDVIDGIEGNSLKFLNYAEHPTVEIFRVHGKSESLIVHKDSPIYAEVIGYCKEKAKDIVDVYEKSLKKVEV